METSKLHGTKLCLISGFFYPKVVETRISFTDFREALCCEYPCSPGDVVELRYFDSTDQRFVPLTCDEHLGLLFSLNADSRFVKSISACFRQAKNVSRRVFRHHLSLLIASVLALLVGRDQVNLVVLKATTCRLPLILPLLLSLLHLM